MRLLLAGFVVVALIAQGGPASAQSKTVRLRGLGVDVKLPQGVSYSFENGRDMFIVGAVAAYVVKDGASCAAGLSRLPGVAVDMSHLVPMGWDGAARVAEIRGRPVTTLCYDAGNARLLFTYTDRGMTTEISGLLRSIAAAFPKTAPTRRPTRTTADPPRRSTSSSGAGLGKRIHAPAGWALAKQAKDRETYRHASGIEVELWRPPSSVVKDCRSSMLHRDDVAKVGNLVPRGWYHKARVFGARSRHARVSPCLDARGGTITALMPAAVIGKPEVRALLESVSATFPPSPVATTPRRAPVRSPRSRPPRSSRTSGSYRRPAPVDDSYRPPYRPRSDRSFVSSYPRRKKKDAVNSILVGGSFLGATALGSSLAIGSDSGTAKTVVGAFVGTGLLVATLRRAAQRGKLRHRDRPKANLLLGDDGWLTSASSQLGFAAGTATQPVMDPATGMEQTDRMGSAGFHWVMRGSLVRGSLSSAFVFGGGEDRSFAGLDVGAGLGVQLFRGGLFSPYTEVRYAFMPNNIGDDSPLAGLDADGIELVVGNTFMFAPLGYRGYSAKGQGTALLSQPNASRFYLDVSYVVDGRDLFGNRLILALGFDHAWWR